MQRKTLALLITSLLAAPSFAGPLHAGFVNPPDAARPRAWWHWMDGNVSEPGILRDLQWMKRVGLGGLQQFDASLQTPKIVAERTVYGSPAWQAYLRTAAGEAQRLGLEFAVASSPGWSLTGGPWVKPAQAMKKLVWSELTVEGGNRNPAVPAPPSVAGPFLDLAAHAESPDHAAAPGWYRDVAVLALPADAPAPVPARILSRAGVDVTAQLSDGRLGQPVQLALGGDGATWVTLDYPQAVSFQALTLAIPAPTGFGTAPLPEVVLQASLDGVHFSDIAPVPLSTAPRQTIAFPAHTAKHWRVLLKASAAGGPPPAAPGVLLPPFGKAAERFPLAEVMLHAQARVHRAEEKAGFAAARDYYAIDTPTAAQGIPARRVIDLTRHLQADGRLDWTVPPGRWTILRFGYSLTGKQNGPAPKEATGLEVDKLNARHVRQYMDDYLGRVAKAVGPELLGRRGVGALLNDSIESGFQNWTDGMETAFAERRGYPLVQWLPALTGRIVDDAAASDRFLWDFRRTISELYTDGHYATVASSAHRQGLKVYGEALEDNRPQLGDDMDMRRHADVPMAAMWAVPAGGQPRTTFVADIQGAASVASVWGRNLVAAESMTAFGQPWGFAPRDLKKTADIEFALGVNRIVIHTSAHQPLEGLTPGMSLAPFLGQYFSRHETWAEQARPWIDYLARASFMLQQGRHAADIAYFYGEEAPITALFGARPNEDIPAGYGFDYVNLTALAQQFSVKDGQLTSRSGGRYQVLYLGGSSQRMTVGALKRISALAEAGATVVGRRPLGTPSLADKTDEFARLADRLWGPVGSAPTIRKLGRGIVHGSGDLAGVLARRGLRPAVALSGGQDGVMVTQRHTPEHEVYFVANTSAEPRAVAASFRDAPLAPEIWHPDTGCVAVASYDKQAGGASVPLQLGPQQSLFVVFPRKAATPGRMASTAEPAALQTLDGPWQLSFDVGRGGPEAPLTMDRLQLWNHSALPGLRHYSGTASYRKTFAIDGHAPGRIVLDLGQVHDLAQVSLNGKLLGTAWKPPYRFDTRDLLRTGPNELEIRVTNLWVNRLVGDAQPGAERVTGVTAVYAASAPLRDSGLVGPVQLMSAPRATCVAGLAQ
ncbi:glycosyl hydrolase [Massilia sp. LjRoot122]|uniref:glycosyl hydrolase n=1 Tax=Massilia sp. LjRoot122 TaxID=3342257 RepID=UPI003ED170ED